MTTTTRSRQPGWVAGRLVLSAWIVLTALSLIDDADGRPYFVIVGIFSIAVVAVLGVRLAVVLVRRGSDAVTELEEPGPSRSQLTRAAAAAATPMGRLRRQHPAVADQVQVALDLLTGPLVPVLGKDDTSRTHRSIESALAEYGSVDQAIDHTVAARHALVATLTGADIDADHDTDAQQLSEHEADLRRRQSETVDRLRRAAAGLQSAWGPVRDQQILELRRGQITQARDKAEAVAAQPVPGTDASAGLIDAIEEIQGSLGGIREIGGINDRILGRTGFPDTGSAPAKPSIREDRR